MTLDKDGCWAVDLFPVFLQISGETPATNGQLHLISDGRAHAGRTHLADEFVTCSIIHWKYRGQGMGRAEKSPGAEHDFDPSPSGGPLDASVNVTFLSCSLPWG